ncbi:MAG TPA: hypothetical protein VL693_21060 [Vicinamibacterales bacterium]|jgi:hypothetical protein|nr:hypothetical protein [Vicinamibacterales bacterium]
MTAASRAGAAHLVEALHGIFGHRLHSVVAYGLDTSAALSCLALVQSVTMADLEACADHAHAWRRHGIATPLILPEDEFRRSLDAFPLEYAEIIRAHEVLFGANPFDGTIIERADLRRACETQIKSHLVHLREGFIETAGTPRAIADLVVASAPAFSALLRNIARLNGSTATDRATATREGARAAQLADGVVTDILGLEQPSALKATDAARLYPEYLTAVEQLARYVDGWNV